MPSKVNLTKLDQKDKLNRINNSMGMDGHTLSVKNSKGDELKGDRIFESTSRNNLQTADLMKKKKKRVK
jgi:hypothetical protein